LSKGATLNLSVKLIKIEQKKIQFRMAEKKNSPEFVNTPNRHNPKKFNTSVHINENPRLNPSLGISISQSFCEVVALDAMSVTLLDK
jgi:hypothetical protein